ncbi:phospholipase D family protein [Marinobacter sp. TBZ242]|uniref:Phospholipase D family protein n=1 Tax=Marinobacter azerbaijanicus TaxID=3050455 RepID=A0ABT7ILF1_9GAMM|nr:phospholipase D family protein [Marinobacter sp. TBZ242]MDL0433983.1 phospholipase D family protein [Marinobacter sp. TBZ242]
MRLVRHGNALEELIVKLTAAHEKIDFAVAWASSGTAAFTEISNRRKKINKAVIGTHFYQTHPDVLDDFVGDKRTRFVLQPQGVFHPKLYVFTSGGEWEILIGSANLTRGAFDKNSEVMLHFTNQDAPDSILQESQDIISGYWADGDEVSKQIADTYRNLWKAQQPSLRRVSSNYGESGKFKAPIHTSIMSMSWDDFFRAVKKDLYHGFSERCDLLDQVQREFRDSPNYSEMSLGVRKTIAGLPNDYNDHWAWFGSMKGAGYFHQAINNNDPHISAALDEIPLEGGITEQHYRSYIEEFVKAFPHGRDGVAVASRLLALKRPDHFVCLDGKNRSQLCKDFGVKKTDMNYDRYWDEVICPIMDSVWWNAPVPTSKSQLKVWAGRAAMLDALFYQP